MGIYEYKETANRKPRACKYLQKSALLEIETMFRYLWGIRNIPKLCIAISACMDILENRAAYYGACTQNIYFCFYE